MTEILLLLRRLSPEQADEKEEGVELSYSNGPAVASTRWTS